MPVSTAHVTTGRAGRYLAQLCRHGSLMSRITSHRPARHSTGDTRPTAPHAASSGTDGVIEFDHGRCRLRATTEALELSAEAEDLRQLQRIQDGIARRLEQIGRRDDITVTWNPATASPGQPANDRTG